MTIVDDEYCKNIYIYLSPQSLSTCTRKEMVHYRQEENPFVKILLTQNEYRLESNIFLLREKINFFLC